MSNTTAKQKKQKKQKNSVRNATQFKLWCIGKGITQKKIHKDTKLSIGCIHATWTDGKAAESTIKLISLVYKINEAELTEMINTITTVKVSSKLQKA